METRSYINNYLSWLNKEKPKLLSSGATCSPSMALFITLSKSNKISFFPIWSRQLRAFFPHLRKPLFTLCSAMTTGR